MKFRESNTFLFSYRYGRFLQELRKGVEIETKKKAQHETGLSQLAILFDATVIEERDLILSFSKTFEKIGYKVTLMGYLDHAADTAGIPYKHFNRRNVSRNFIPSGVDVGKFLESEFDLLINTDLSQSLPIHYLACLAKSYTKVGPHSAFDEYYHLILDTKDTFTIKQYISELIDILNKVSFNGRLES